MCGTTLQPNEPRQPGLGKYFLSTYYIPSGRSLGNILLYKSALDLGSTVRPFISGSMEDIPGDRDGQGVVLTLSSPSPDHKGRGAEQSGDEVREWAGPRPEGLCAVLRGGEWEVGGLPRSDGATGGLEQGDIPTCILGRLS